MDKTIPVVIGPKIRVQGTVRGAEDLVLEGRIEGSVSLPANHLIVAPEARLVGSVEARGVVLRGELAGRATAADKVELDASSRVLGDLRTQRLVVADGAKFKGRVEMTVDLPPGLSPAPKQ